MNKTVTVNIGGIVFHIDENAYEKFKLYLEAISGHFTTADGRDEIMQDIEARIAEMFLERVKDSKQVITLDDVEDVTRLMGKPEDFGGSEEKKEQAEEQVHTGTVKRRLFRNPDDKLLGGVCSGISSYFDIDPVWIRLAFAISFFAWGAGFWFYIILWIVIPEAKNAAEKLQMKGEPVTVSNIQKSVKEEMEGLKKRMDEMSKGSGKKAGTIIGRVFEAIGEVFVFIFRLIGKFIGVIFIFIGLLTAFVMFVSLFALVGFPGTHISHVWYNIFNTHTQFVWSYAGVLLLVGIPFLMLAYAGLRMLFNMKKGSRVIGSTALGLWIFGLVICLYNGAEVSKEFREKESLLRGIPVAHTTSKTLYLEMNEEKNSARDYEENFRNDFDWVLDGKRKIYINGKEYSFGRVKLDIIKSKTDSFELSEILFSYGPSQKEAADFASRINYSFVQSDSIISFNSDLSVGKDERFRNQHVQLVLKMPVGSRIHLDNSLLGFMYNIKNVDYIFDDDMVDRDWEMTDKGLKCLTCNGKERRVGGWKVHVKDEEGEEVTTDKYGVTVKEKGKEVVKIDGNGIRVHSND